MTKPTRLWVIPQPQPRVLVAREHAPATVMPCLQIRVSRRCQGAELIGPWLLRAAVRIPAQPSGPGAVTDPRAWMGALHARWLGHMGLARTRTWQVAPVAHWAAFSARSGGDVMVGDRKIVDVTEIRRPGGTLVVATTLLRPPPWALLCRTLDRSWEEIPHLVGAATNVSSELHCTVDEQRWAASLRSMLQMSLTLPQLRGQDGGGAGAGIRQDCKAR